MADKIWANFIKNLKDDFFLDSDFIICPYCYKYQEYLDKSCSDCIMMKKDNFCHENDSNYYKIIKELKSRSIIEAIPDIRERLIKSIDEGVKNES